MGSKTLTIEQAGDLAEVGPLLGRATAHAVGGPCDVRDLIGGCRLFKVSDGAETVGAFVARLDRYSDGATLTVTAAGARPGADMVPALVAWADHEARKNGVNSLQCITRRPGLVRKLCRAGYEIVGHVLERKLTHGQ